MGNNYLVGSSALMFIPAGISVFTQAFPFTLIFLFSAIFSMLYHWDNQSSYMVEDVVLALLSMIAGLILLTAISIKYSVYSWRVVLPSFFAILGVALYFFAGRCNCDGSKGEVEDDYILYHSLWHLFLSLSAGLIVITPIKVSSVLDSSYHESKGNMFIQKKMASYIDFMLVE